MLDRSFRGHTQSRLARLLASSACQPDRIIYLFSSWEEELSSQIAVMKFGGTSVENAAAFERVANIVRSHERAAPVVVVSAMSGVTDAFIRSSRMAARGEIAEALRSVEEHLERHLRVTSELSAAAQARMRALVEDSRRDIIELLSIAATSRAMTAALQDMITSHGERLSANLLTIVLEEHGLPVAYVDARRCILTNEDYGSAKPLVQETGRRTRAEIRPLLERKKVPVLGGFIAASRNGATTTLGRGSSDYTATLVSAALDARETQIWTDVNGVLTADPGVVKTARTIPELSYAEASELARLGARVLHPGMIQPLVERKIPLRICNSRAPEESGTLVCARTEASPASVKAIAHKTDLTAIEITSTREVAANGFLQAIRTIFKRHQTQVDLIGMSGVNISLACTDEGALPSIVKDLRHLGTVQINGGRAVIGCIGEGLQRAADTVAKFLNAIRDIDPALTWQSTSDVNLMSIVDADSVGPVIRRLHYAIFERDWAQRDGTSLS